MGVSEEAPLRVEDLRRWVRGTTGLYELLQKARATVWRRLFPGSLEFWKRQYMRGEASGRGSEGELRDYKATVLNRFIEDQGVRSVIDLGCGEGRQAAALRCEQYTGLDVSPAALIRALALLGERPSWAFYLYDPRCFHDTHRRFQADLAVSLDVIYHLVEDEIFDLYMRHLFSMASRHVVIYSVNDERPSPVPYTRPRKFTDWIRENVSEWQLVERIPNPYAYDYSTHRGSWSDFFFYQRSPSPDSSG